MDDPGKLSVVGKNVLRRDTTDKAKGKTLYADDISLPNMLWLGLVRSPLPHARIMGYHLKEAKKIPGIVFCWTYHDLLQRTKEQLIGNIEKDWPLLARDVVRFVGDPMVLVCAESAWAVQEAVSRIKVDLESLTVVSTVEEALAHGAPQLHPNGNVLWQRKIVRGNIDEAFANAVVIVDNTYSCGRCEHSYLETEAGIAWIEDDGTLTLWVSTQVPHLSALEIARVTGLPLNKIQVIQAATGGGFGGKDDVVIQHYLALAALETSRPVKLTLTREESFLASPKRHPAKIYYRSAADRNGKLLGIEVKILLDTGAYASYGRAVCDRTAVLASGPYEVPNCNIESVAVYTNNPISGAMRGFGTPQVAFAHESQMDLLASQLGISPVEIRWKNMFQEGSLNCCGQQMYHVGARATLEKIVPVFQEQHNLCLQENTALSQQDALRRVGLGVGSMWYGLGMTSTKNPARAETFISESGKLVVRIGCSELGQGSTTTLAQIAAEAAGVSYDAVEVFIGNSLTTPDGGVTSASRITWIGGKAVFEAAVKTREQLLTKLAGELAVDPVRISLRSGKVYVDEDYAMTVCKARMLVADNCRGEGCYDPDTEQMDPENGQGKPYEVYVYASQIAKVEVNLLTGQAVVKKMWAVHDAGRIVHPQNARGQVEGGIVMGIGMALHEEFVVEGGNIRTPSLSTYVVPAVADTPEMEVLFVEEQVADGAFGAKGIGEPPLIPTAAAVLNAVAEAIGQRVQTIPASAERILKALNKL